MGSAAARRKGFSLIESIVVAGVLSLIVIFTLAVIPSFKMSNRRANMELQAGSLAQSALEQLRTLPFGSAASTAFEDVTDDGITYHRQVQVSDIIVAATTGREISHRVRVVVSWSWSDRHYQTFRETVLCNLLRS
jgi:prepilin-type N-terminal cleavage/methylation domain-containing protein